METVQVMGEYIDADDIVKGFGDGSPLAMYLNKFDASVRGKMREKIKDELIRKFGNQSNKIPLQAIVCEAYRRKK
ncbi:MAG: hypothetical protein ABR502_01490 [Chitinophagaceae bacterium]